MRRFLLVLGSLWTGFNMFLAGFAAVVRTDAALPASSIAGLAAMGLAGGAVLCAPFFARPPTRRSSTPWLIRLPIPFSGIVLRPIARLGYEIQHAPWALARRARPVQQAEPVAGGVS